MPLWNSSALTVGLMVALHLSFPSRAAAQPPDPIRDLQNKAIAEGKSTVAHWGSDPTDYKQWATHSNRLIPVYTFGTRGTGRGVDLDDYRGEKSIYRSADALQRLYGFVPERTVNPHAEYMDQTNVFDIQLAALKAGKKQIFLVIFDGMDWHSTRSAAIATSGRVYHEGRGSGLFWLDYMAADTTQFGYMVTAPYGNKAIVNVDRQTVESAEKTGGYDATLGGAHPWSTPTEREYLKGEYPAVPHPYTDSASSADSMAAGIKTFNAAINVTPAGKQVDTIAHLAQREGFAVGVVTSVPISHATPAACYAHNVDRDDYQDLTRDMLGMHSISHPHDPLPGLDLVLGAGDRVNKNEDPNQGSNFVPGNRYLTDADLKAVDVSNGGGYVVSRRRAGTTGRDNLLADVNRAAETGKDLLGFYGTAHTHLPYRTADGDYQPAKDRNGSVELYSRDDLTENPTLPDMTEAALEFLSERSDRFWLMVEAGDVDFASHQNNLDNMIGAILSGDDAIRKIAGWVEKHSSWNDAVMIVTADHGHYLFLDHPEELARVNPRPHN